MTFAVMGTSQMLCQCMDMDNDGATLVKVAVGTLAFDICVIVSGIVVGALALCGYIDLPPAASYATLGVGCGFLALDVACNMMVGMCCDNKPDVVVTHQLGPMNFS